ncbi:MAG: bifunctional oligoribonuclease/PAP phosphatase NrnA [Crocinitomicaceae bacterium]|nr:bifunctional oligoribonuclease/PAP phosphatase NrnA [Crocinitomicaceae bacterium]
MEKELVLQAKNWIESAKHIVIIGHKSPDGDSVGSSLGLYNTLIKFKEDVQVCMPDPYPGFLRWMKGTDEIKNFEQHTSQVMDLMEQADLIFCLDFNSETRVGKMENSLREASAKKIMIDHHQDPSDFADITFSFPNECSTSQLIYKFLAHAELLNYLDADAGACLYCGIMTDTGSFKFPNTSPETHRIIANLMENGVDHYKIHELVFDQNTEDKLKLRSSIISNSLRVLEEYKTAIIAVSQKDLEKFNYEKGDTEGLVNVALSLGTVNRSAFFTEEDGLIKISFRSKGIENPVNGIASKYFEGGGHINAAGGKYLGTLDQAVQKFVTVLPEFV